MGSGYGSSGGCASDLVGGDQLALVVAGAGADGENFALARLFLGGVGNDDAAGGLLVFLDPADRDTVMQRPEFHGIFPWFGLCLVLLALPCGECQLVARKSTRLNSSH